ncbi:unnamed protein product [Rhizophagus irregularis]|nr:unnamed protein product [Rhizophagus irregularis]
MFFLIRDNLKRPNVFTKRQIIFIDQRVNGGYLESWKYLRTLPDNNFKERKPNWFQKLETDGTLSNYNRRLISPLTSPSINKLYYKTPKILSSYYYRPNNEWTKTWDPTNNTEIYGKRWNPVGSITYREHYIPHIDTDESLSTLTPRRHTPILRPCKGCRLHSPYYRPKCVVMTCTEQLTKFSIHTKQYKPKVNMKPLKIVYSPLLVYSI